MTQQDATVNVHVNNQEAEQKVKELSDRARQLRKEFAEAVRIGDKGTIAKTEKELRKVNKELNNATLRAARIRDAMKHLSQATPKELQNTLKLINQELNSGAVKRGSKEWKAYQEQIKQVNAELRKIQAESREVATSLKDKMANIANAAVAITSGMAIYDEVIGKLRALVTAYADHDAALANTQKYTGMSSEEVEQLNEQLKGMDTRTSIEGLNELAQAAGRLGKNSVEDVMGFVRAGDIIGVAMDELGADAPQIISQLAGIFNLEGELGTEKAMLSVGSAINTLSQNCAAGTPNLVDFASRMGAIANSTNMSMDEMLAFGALLDDQKVSVEKASTAMQGVITKMYADPATFAKKAGLNVQEFTDALKRSSTEGIMMFVDSLSKMDSMQQAATLKDLGTAGAGVVQTFQTLAGKTDLLNQQMQTSKQAFADATSATEEFGVQNNTVQAQLDKAKKGFNEMAVELGEHLYPVMKYTISGTSLLMRGMKVLIEFVINHKGALLSLTAAYFAYQIAVNKAIIVAKTDMVITKTATALKYAWTVATQAAAIASALFARNLHQAKQEFIIFSALLKTNPMGLLVSGITLAITGLMAWGSAASNAKKKAAELRAEAEKLKNSYTDLSEATAEGAKSETAALKRLYNAATNEIRSKEERLKAANKLIEMYPDYFKNMNTEAIMAGRASLQYNALTKSIINTAKARAAAEKIKNNEGEIIDLQLEQEKHRERIDYLNSTLTPIVGSHEDRIAAEYSPARTEIKLAEAEIKIIQDKINIIEKSNQKLEKIAENITSDLIEPDLDFTNVYSDDKDKDKTNKSEEKKKREAEAKGIMQNELDMINANIEQEQTINFSNYTLGLSSYKDYVEKKHQLTIHGLDMQIKALEDAELTETDAYKNLVKQKEKLADEHNKTILRLDLDTLNQEKEQREKVLTESLYNPNSPMFGNETAYRQGLLESDLKYLEDKKKLYATDSEEHIKIQQEINDRIAQDQLAKQKETAEALVHFQEEYGKASGLKRMQMELATIEELHKQGLISEEEYNKAVNDIRDQYRQEDIDRERTVQSEYADLVLNLYNSFKEFFDELGESSANTWANIANAAQAAYAIMSTALSQYSAYADAERDLELAKIEHRYDAEIESAGKNSKKKEQLEKQKEEEIAKVKKEHNDRAMKIEIAQAIAQTAMSAIAAYSAGLQVGGPAGLILAPIAAALAVAAGAIQIATIKKQHQAQAIGFYEGGFTGKSRDNHKEVGVVHANEFVANHKAVANPRLAPLFNLLNSAQRNNTVGSLSAQDVSNALGQGRGVVTRAEVGNSANEQVGQGLALVAGMMSSAGNAIDRLNKRIDDGIETVMIMDGERGFARKYETYNNLKNNAKL